MPNDFLTAVVVSPDDDLYCRIEQALAANSLAGAVWKVSDYPETSALAPLRNARPGCVLFLDFRDPVRARRIAAELDRAYPEVSVVAIHEAAGDIEIGSLAQMGVPEIISNPVTPSKVSIAFSRAAQRLRPAGADDGKLFAFLPAKAGAGATTVAIGTAAAVARIRKERTLLLDFDLRLGVTSFLLKLDGHGSVQDALQQAGQGDEDLLPRIATHREHLDILGSAPVQFPAEIQTQGCPVILNRAQARYGVTIVDLPGTMELYELDALVRASEIFLVFTPDAAGLHMAKRKSEALKALDLSGKVTGIMNQVERRSALALSDIEDLLGLPVRFSLPSDTKAVSRAVLEGTGAPDGSALAAQIEPIAKSIAGPADPGSSGAPRRFIEFFSVSPWDRDRWCRG